MGLRLRQMHGVTRSGYNFGLNIARAMRVNRLHLIDGRTVGDVANSFLGWTLSKGASNTVPVHGHKMLLDRRAYGLGAKFWAGNFEGATTELFESSLHAGMVVVDVGAHIGYYTLLAARRVGAPGRVYAFEPESHNYALLQKNVELNGYRNVVPVKKALSNRSGHAKLYLQDSAQHSLHKSHDVVQFFEMIEATTLDAFLEEEGWPDAALIKMDIEGNEPYALAGMQKLINKAKELRLIVEFAPLVLKRAGTEPASFLDQLQALGFKVDVVDEEEGLQPLDVSALLPQLTGETDYVNLLCQK